ncbi:hypothetical protein [Bradyrhizobium sp. USDA 4506]
MASNEPKDSVTGAGTVAPRIGSLLDQPLRYLLLRAAHTHEPGQFLINSGSVSEIMAGDWPRLPPFAAPQHSSKFDADLLYILERERSDVASVARFSHRVEYASFCIYVAFDKAQVLDFQLTAARNFVRPKRGVSIWYSHLVNSTFNRYRDLKRALLHHWTPPAEVEALTTCAFRTLSEITPAESQLLDLFINDRPRAFHELTRHLDLVADQLKAAIDLASDLETDASGDVAAEDQLRVEAVQTELLEKAGESLSLTEAAKRLGVSRQALHKRIGLATALGLMYGSELVVPEAQFVTTSGKLKIVDGLSDVVRLFDNSGAGRWSALQFLIQIDPNLGRTPLEALKAGEQDVAVRAARAYLSLDEA